MCGLDVASSGRVDELPWIGAEECVSCGARDCMHLGSLLISVFGVDWRSVVFYTETLPEFDTGQLNDLMLLLGLAAVDSARLRLFDMLGQCSRAGMLARRFVCVWQQLSGAAFPAEDECSRFLVCVELVISGLPECRGSCELLNCPVSVLALLCMRLGVRLPAAACCTAVCWLGSGCAGLALVPFGLLLCDSQMAGSASADRGVLLSCTGRLEVSVVTLQLRIAGERKTVWVSVHDSPVAARLQPMELTALRAALQHRSFCWLGVRWLCTLTPVQRRISCVSDVVLPGLVASVFRNPAVAAEWAGLAIQLKQLYRSRSASLATKAAAIGKVMSDMAKLLPFCYCKAVQKVLQLPLLDVDLGRKGHFVYCLLSPFLGKVYVGAVGLRNKPRAPYARLREHQRMARLWSSATSRRRYGSRTPNLYRALAKAGMENVVMVILAEATQANVASVERAYIRHLSPVFNIVGTSGEEVLPLAVKRLLGSAASDDVRLVAAAVLRKNRPRLPVQAWPVLIAQVLRTGDRETAAKLARQARQVCPQLSRLRSAPRLVFPCPVPLDVLYQLRGTVVGVLKQLPFIRRTPQFTIMVEATAVCWERTSFAEAVLSPSTIQWEQVGDCQCGTLAAELPRLDGHVIARTWSDIACCRVLTAVAGTASLQCRTFPSLKRIVDVFALRLQKYLRLAGFSSEDASTAVDAVRSASVPVLKPWLHSLAPVFKQKSLIAARAQIWAGGMVVVRLDRNPGRVIVICRKLWSDLQNTVFLQNPRYVRLDSPAAVDDVGYGRRMRESFLAAVPGSEPWAGRSPAGGSARPQSYWTIKQKSLISSVGTPVVKMRPLITHCKHPLRVALRRVARALAVLVGEARDLVLKRRLQHLPMWQLHSGSAEWLGRIAATARWWGCEEYDVADCFLNTPRKAVLAAVRFWLETTQRCSRRQPAFAISKDGKAGDHRGRPSSVHYWEITAEQLLAACEWDLAHSDAFEAQSVAGDVVVLRQWQGLPIGGHLSAAYVELVALRREYEREWPLSLQGTLTCRYRDNFFVVVPLERTDAERQETAADLTALLEMPVGFERAGRIARCLELRLDWTADAGVRAVLAYRTDPDRQGESHDVRTWPDWDDPRAGAVLHGLLAGLASKVVRYATPSVGGFTASIRGAVRFLRGRRYPTKRWLRPFAVELLRMGAPLGCLPQALKVALGAVSQRAAGPSADSGSTYCATRSLRDSVG